eukprot:scaffold166896_cov28-Prasinocladus_malaysianus.AAC.4
MADRCSESMERTISAQPGFKKEQPCLAFDEMRHQENRKTMDLTCRLTAQAATKAFCFGGDLGEARLDLGEARLGPGDRGSWTTGASYENAFACRRWLSNMYHVGKCSHLHSW